jgi:hypothetical protein
MVDRQFIVARMVADTPRRITTLVRRPLPLRRAAPDRAAPRGLSHPRIDANCRSTI